MSRTPVTFPPDFIWATATAATQIEGAADADGKGPSIWDHFAAIPGKIRNGDSPARTCDHYHRYPEDIALMRELGIRHYRLSVCWPRIFPNGSEISTTLPPPSPNQPGLDFYKRLIDQLHANDITPWVTFYHWDLPQALEDRHGGWRSRKTVDAFAHYADTLVRALGDRVRHWFTINEIFSFTRNGYGTGRNAPGLREPEQIVNQTYHHALLAHGHAVRAVREHGAPGALVGMADNPRIPIPLDPSSAADIAAAREVFVVDNIRVLEPLHRSAYTDTYRRIIDPADHPHIAPGDFELISSPTDFFGFNAYSGYFVRAGHDGHPERVPFSAPFAKTDCDWHHITPQSLYWGPRFYHEVYGPHPIYIAENGCGYINEHVIETGDDSPNSRREVLDVHRQVLLRENLLELHRAIADGVPVRGYFHWSFMDNFEWTAGNAIRFGLVHVDYATQRRTPKLSARWYAGVMRDNGLA
ncbi:glycoside hydrolase family 1 protein [Geminisphaera colitermitum]|uniref:glycoside hydrolase family 1 protein n=1 Tax=Geminisphaera colitermitum TaxID=1148786 RepID=UPI000158CE7F|nr:family 1 glycosylhydrolase [Geminisphaera colitermitum]